MPTLGPTTVVMGHDKTNDKTRTVGVSNDGDLLVDFGSEGTKDSFGRLRVSNPTTIFDSKQLFDNQPNFWDEALESGGGISSSYDTNEAATTITSTLNTAGVFTRQTFQSFNYQPGKSQLIQMTGVLNLSGGGTGVQRRIGQFNDDNGLYFEDDEGTIKIVKRSYFTGSAVETKVSQADWNIDKMDGTGRSGITMDFSKAQIFAFDYEWLGVGNVRFAVGNPSGPGVLYVHEMFHAGALTGVYMSTPNLPLRYQMVTTSSSPASSMMHVCASVISEGGIVNNGMVRGKSMGSTHVDAQTVGVIHALVGIKLKAAYIGAVCPIVSFSVVATTNDDFEWIIYLNPTVAGSFTYANETNSAIMSATGAAANTITGGTVLDCGYSKAESTTPNNATTTRYLGAAIDGTVDEIVLCARPLGSGTVNADLLGALNWRELQ